MGLQFPNRSRSLDNDGLAIRFSGYDGMFEIRFSMDLVTLERLTGAPAAADDASLTAFDGIRTKVETVAIKTYQRSRKSSYRLAASDFGY
ncbi:uncharacterized protein DUF1488 [Hoeflea marina]|uniref:Uncharacterized protein DUF1488 n=1 Tax=Hoeflea marina TaxID=274592 RepID=A0A317PL49_9HYPH|nr:DUF1488 family protein [Hoeflea marina]PWW01662.1 uncharacterized protein DUF1488 [Hoeflea marina]